MVIHHRLCFLTLCHKLTLAGGPALSWDPQTSFSSEGSFMHRGYLQLSSHPFVHLSSWASSQRGLQPIRAKEPSTDQPRKLVFGLGGDVHSEKTELVVLTTTLSHRLVLILHLERFPDQASAGNKFKVFLWSGPQILVDHIASFAFHLLLLSSTDHRNADAAPLSHFVLLFFPKQD